ncbi:radical SAM family heme chaperone HemW [Muriicola sp. Z0-33]|uniref:radical SAM family heme chaperone HemW n=1 Tax=Muriicola sp. Z0-33 TaxID=2816957 RepID=UPI002237D710|nr:radical SAM family heme chaperone HemW [Muriicola sp. Z0-33]MCW5517217.1 radical SAM family heme chaperone HemW [Muriicola sp. Z0-33]
MSGIYIHIPFCKQACHYCDFHFSTTMAKKTAMVHGICRELELRKEEFANEEVQTIYFGGGTPSVLELNEIEDILDTVNANYTIIDEPEITLEANPDDLTKEVIAKLASTPINRLSIGIQSFNDQDLQLMNRAHNADEAEKCIACAGEYFDNISIDLIYGIPNMSTARWTQNIEKALSFNIPHISSYALTVEPRTALKKFIEKGLVPDVDDEAAREQFLLLIKQLEKDGFVHYEVSNFGKPGYFSRNNTAYWQGKKYLGIGPSSHSYDGKSRAWNIANNPKYIKAITMGILPMEREILTKRDNYNEYVMTGLRTIWGVSLAEIEVKYGSRYRQHLAKESEKFLEQGLLRLDKETLLVTKKGKFLTDGIAADLFLLNLKDRK